jgi:hypothetical protein
MPSVIDYPLVLEHMRSFGFKSLYHNSGAFGFSDPSHVRHVGWIGPADSTLRPAAIPFTRSVPAPYGSALTTLLVNLWRQSLPGPLWLLPMSHWAYELDVNESWLGPALQSAGIDPATLKPRNTGNAIEFSPDESASLSLLCQHLLENLSTSDYTIAFPPKPLLCTLHHHKQLWWTTTDDTVYTAIDSILPKPN